MDSTGQITAQQVREARQRYDALTPDEKAALGRCPDAQAITMERTFWKVASEASDDVRLRLAHLIACFPAAEQLPEPAGFRTGTLLRELLHPGKARVEPAEAARFRQLITARDIDELVPRMRRLLAAGKRPVDWGVLGRDMFNWSEKVRKTWSQDFYNQGE